MALWNLGIGLHDSLLHLLRLQNQNDMDHTNFCLPTLYVGDFPGPTTAAVLS